MLFVRNIKNEVIRDMNAENAMSVCALMIVLMRFTTPKLTFDFSGFEI